MWIPNQMLNQITHHQYSDFFVWYTRSSKSFQSFILYTFNDIFQCQSLSTTLVIYVWMLRRMGASSRATPTCRRSATKYFSQPEETHGSGTVAITCKRGRACPQEELNWGDEAWEDAWRCHGRVPMYSYFKFHSLAFFSATAHWWQHKIGVVMRSIDDRDGERESLTLSSASIGEHFPV